MALFSIFKRPGKPNDPISGHQSGAPVRRSSDTSKSSARAAKPAQPYPEEIQRIAKATREKIDAIESQMSREANAIRVSGERRSVHSLNTTTPKVSPQTRAPAKPIAKSPVVAEALSDVPTIARPVQRDMAPFTTRVVAVDENGEFKPTVALGNEPNPLEDFNMSTDFLLGNSTHANAIELNVSLNNPVIEEAAILYANGQTKAAAMSLEQAVKENTLGESILDGWLMLFELYQVMGKQAEFESLSLDFVDRFEMSAPSWDIEADNDKQHKDSNKQSYVAFPFKVDASAAKQINQIKSFSASSNSLRLDFSRPKSVDNEGAQLLLKALQDLRKSHHEITLSGQDKFIELLLSQVEVGRQDESDVIWKLLLEFYQLLDKQNEFEDMAVNYSITYEVSPPSWENVLGKVHTNMVSPDDEFAATAIRVDAFEFKGDIKGKAEQELAALNQYAEQYTHLIIECKHLKRIEFSAAGLLLNWLFNMRIVGKTVEMLEVSPMLMALFKVIGAQELAKIEGRKF